MRKRIALQLALDVRHDSRMSELDVAAATRGPATASRWKDGLSCRCRVGLCVCLCCVCALSCPSLLLDRAFDSAAAVHAPEPRQAPVSPPSRHGRTPPHLHSLRLHPKHCFSALSLPSAPEVESAHIDGDDDEESAEGCAAAAVSAAAAACCCCSCCISPLAPQTHTSQISRWRTGESPSARETGEQIQ